MTSKIALAVLNHVKDVPSFVTREVFSYFPAVPQSYIKDAIKELIEDKKVFVYGAKRGTFYSVNLNFGEEEKSDELSPKLIIEVENFVADKRDFSSSDLFAALPGHPDHILRKVLVHLRDDKGTLFLHGHGKTSIWSKHAELPEEEETPDEKVDSLKEEVLKFAQENLRWFKRSELDKILEENSAYEIRQALFSLMDDGEIQMRGEKRSTEYAYYEVLDAEEGEEEEVEIKADPVLKEKLLDHIKTAGVITVPDLIKKFELARNVIMIVLRELEDEEEIYHEGIKKTSRYIHKDTPTSKVDVILKENKDEKKEFVDKSIDKLSTYLATSNVYIIFINSSKKYELRQLNCMSGSVNILFADEDSNKVAQELFELTKGVEVEPVI